MQYDWHPSSLAFLDFETQSRAELTTVHKYASHESTRALCLCISVDGRMHRFGPYLNGEAKDQIDRITAGRTLVAHNAPFDAAIWRMEMLPERTWFDTLPCCRAAGLPGGLDQVAKALGGRGKDKNGKMLIDMLCIVRGKVPAIGPAHKLLIDYCAQDVEELVDVFEAVHDYVEPAVMSVDATINERGIPVDRAYLHALKPIYERVVEVHADEFERMAPGVNPGSPKQVLEWMGGLGFSPQVVTKEGTIRATINKAAMKSLMDNPEEYYAGEHELDDQFAILKEAMAYRSDVVRVGGSKVTRALEVLEDDGRVRDQLVYWGAHTGRWSGRVLQPHNFPSTQILRGYDVNWVVEDPTFDNVMRAAKEASEKNGYRVAASDVLAAMLRPMVKAPALVADYASVELRGTAYVARCQRMLDVLSDPKRSVYVDMGRQLFGKDISKDDPEYAFCKQLVLGCTYGMSGTRFDTMCKMRNVQTDVLKRAGLDTKKAVKLFRETYPELPAVWAAYGEAVKEVVTHRTQVEAGMCFFYMSGPHLHMQLPSERCIVYRNARIEMMVPAYCRMYNMPEEPVPTVVYDSPRFKRGFLYGSKVCENAVQGLARDLLADGLVNLESDGFHPIFHVHDEVGCEDDIARFHRFLEVLSTPPTWAPDFPHLVEGYAGHRWTKQPKGMKGARHGAAMCGRVL